MSATGVISSYLECALLQSRVKKIIDAINTIVEQNQIDFDTVVFRGVSGGLIAPIVAFKLKKELVVVRKGEEYCHAARSTEGNSLSKKYIIIDDCIESGDTLNSIYKSMKDFCPESVCSGAILYDSPESSISRPTFVTSDSVFF